MVYKRADLNKKAGCSCQCHSCSAHIWKWKEQASTLRRTSERLFELPGTWTWLGLTSLALLVRAGEGPCWDFLRLPPSSLPKPSCRNQAFMTAERLSYEEERLSPPAGS